MSDSLTSLPMLEAAERRVVEHRGLFSWGARGDWPIGILPTG